MAQAVDENEGFGVESYSDPVTVDPSEGLCMPRNERDIGAETFSAQVKYTGAKDPKHPNLIRVRILVPHFDGLLPAISTRQLSNFEIALSPDASRVAQHTCSNLLDIDEIRTRFGFLKNGIIDPDNAGESLPYQYDIGLRGNATLRYLKFGMISPFEHSHPPLYLCSPSSVRLEGVILPKLLIIRKLFVVSSLNRQLFLC